MPTTGGRDVDVFAVVGAMASVEVGATAKVAVGCTAVSVGITTGGVSVAAGSVGSTVGGMVVGRDVGVTTAPGEQAASVRITILIRMVLFFILSPVSVYDSRIFRSGECSKSLRVVLSMY